MKQHNGLLGKPKGWKKGDGPYNLYRQRLEQRLGEDISRPVREVVVVEEAPIEAQKEKVGVDVDGLIETWADLPGEWERKVVDSNHEMFASFDGWDQFYVKRYFKTGRHVRVKMKGGEVVEVRDTIPAKVESVRIVWPGRMVASGWDKKGTKGG